MGESLRDPFEPMIPELQPELVQGIELPPASIEPLADWIISHETLPSEPENHRSIPAEELKEIHFERVHEIKEDPEDEADPHVPSLQPMVPIADVLKSRNLMPAPSSEKKRPRILKRLQGILKPSNTSYATAVTRGFVAGLTITVIVAAVLLIRNIT